MKEKTEAADSRLAAILLAAGASSRLGFFKPLLPVGDTHAVIAIIRKLRSICSRIITVTGYRGEEVHKLVRDLGDPSVLCSGNVDWERGMFSSLQTGASSLPADMDFFIHMVDQPHIPESVYDSLLDAWKFSSHAVFIPTFHGRTGHPVICRSILRDDILAGSGTDTTRTILKPHRLDTRLVPVDSEAILHTINTSADLAYITEKFL